MNQKIDWLILVFKATLVTIDYIWQSFFVTIGVNWSIDIIGEQVPSMLTDD